MSQPATDSLTETLVQATSVYEGDFLKVRRDHVRLPDGGMATREYIVHPGAVAIVPLLDDGRLLLERQFRYPVGRVMLEFPAGKMDPGEDVRVCGQRELREETGYSAAQWADAGQIHLAIGYSTEVLHVFFARGLTAGQTHLDEGEFVEAFPMTQEDFLAACTDGRITDAKTLACGLRLAMLRSGQWQPRWQPA